MKTQPVKSQDRESRIENGTPPARELRSPAADPQSSPAPQPAAAKPRVWPAVVSGLLFFGWLGYLIFLVVTLPQAPGGGPVVLSRPQFLVSDLDVSANITDLRGPVVIDEVFYPREGGPSPGQKIVVSNLAKCAPDWRGPGRYILALRPTGLAYGAWLTGLLATPGAGPLQALCLPGVDVGTALGYEVAPTPPSPGFRLGPPRIYFAIPATEAQVKEIARKKI